MTRLSTMIHGVLAIILMFSPPTQAEELPMHDQPVPHIDLSVSFDHEQSLLRATARVRVPAGHGITLNLTDLQLTAALLSQPGRDNLPLDLGSNRLLPIAAASFTQSVLLSYEKKVTDTERNSMTDRYIVLTSAWHPLPDRPATFTLSVEPPPGFSAISETDRLGEQDDNGWHHFSFSQPVHGVHLALAPFVKTSRSVRPGLDVYTYFLDDDPDLAHAYLDAAVAYLNRYEQHIGPFPYQHYVIVENDQQTGLGLPTFTLLGSRVIRLPFIRETSLGHEILHSWFGNSIAVTRGSGNWAEGLTTYLADLAYRDDVGEGAAARKEALIGYESYVTETTAPLRAFLGSDGHGSMTRRDLRAVGYSRSALLFHELKQRVGETVFNQAIRRFYQAFRGRSATWSDIAELFSAQSGERLDGFFNERLDRVDLPQLQIDGIKTQATADGTRLSFTVHQLQPGGPYRILLPIAVETVVGTSVEHRLIDTAGTTIDLELPHQPLTLIIDPDYDLARRLTPAERRPTWSRAMGAKQLLVVLADDAEQDIYAPFFRLARRFSWQVAKLDELDAEQLAGRDLIMLGTSHPFTRGLFGAPVTLERGFLLEARFHPVHRERQIVLISASDTAQTEAAVDRLHHYGTASQLRFADGRLLERTIAPSEDGIRLPVIDKPAGIATARLHDFDDLVADLADTRVIFIGETHTSRADRLLQTLLIEALYRQDPRLAIGMEMFPATSQPAIDRYLADPQLSEAAFLKESRYFQVWGYDYRLLRPIITFARQRHVPIVALNIERQLVNAVYASGGAGALTDEQRQAIPIDRDLGLPGYRDRLAAVHNHHAGNQEGGRSLASFIEAQSLWDEAMAEAIARFLVKHPDHRLVVLAGSQHTRTDSGIPPRLARRLPVAQATVVNLAEQSLTDLNVGADYLFFLTADDLEPAGRIGVSLQEGDAAQVTITAVEDGTLAAAAGLQPGDVLVAVAGLPIGTIDDVRIAMLDRFPGESISLTIYRTGADNHQESLVLQGELSAPPTLRRHP